ncbi:hypothetical protein [Mailhella sp.]
MSQINATNSLSQIMADIDLGPTGSLQFMFAKLQMAQSQICKNEAESYMKQIETIQEEQAETAEMIELARKLQDEAKSKDKCTDMPPEMVKFFEQRGLSWEETGGDKSHNADEWDYNLKSLTNYQEQIGNKTQTLMIYLQDFIGQYNSYQEGAMSAISSATQTLRSIAKGQ